MSSHENNVGKYQAFQNEVNIKLCNAVLSLAAATSKHEEVGSRYRKALSNIIWGENIDHESFFESRNLRYLGEILERFESKFSSEKEDFRAIALALGYASPFIQDDMFVGNQKVNFLGKLSREAKDDVYLLGALYLLTTDPEKKKQIWDRLLHFPLKTEEVVFVLSLSIGQDQERGYEEMRAKLVQAWGKERTIPLIGNTGILEWLIQNYGELIKGSRKKEMMVLRSLVKLPFMYAKKDSPVFRTLSEAGYSKKEISYANSQMIWANEIWARLSYFSIPAEKIASDCCLTMLNSEEAMEPEIYDYIGWLMERYNTFEIKYQGNQGIWEAIREELKPVSSQTVLWMIKNIKKKFDYHFDVFDTKWDILAQDLDADTYQDLFVEQLLCQQDLSESDARKWLARYSELLETDFMSYFSNGHIREEECFALLVEKKVICLWQFFKEHVSYIEKDNHNSNELYCVMRYCKSAKTREGFEFLELLLEDYDFTELEEIFYRRYKFHDAFLIDVGSLYYGSNPRIDIRRPFLTNEEQKKLFEWIDESVFRTEPGKYYPFVITAIKDACVQEIFCKEELREVLKELILNNQLTEYESAPLKKKFYTEQELLEDRIAKEQQKEKEKRERQQQALNAKKEKLEKVFDGSYASLDKYVNSYYGEDEKKSALNLAYEKLENDSVQYGAEVTSTELSKFLHLCAEFAKLEVLPRELLKMQIEQMMGE